jgi:hypothetical protein
VRERLAAGTGLLEAQRGGELVGVDQQQHQVAATGEAGARDRGVLGCRGAADEAVTVEGRRGVDPVAAGSLPVLPGGQVEMTLTRASSAQILARAVDHHRHHHNRTRWSP